MLYKLARPAFFSLDPEVAHDLTLQQMQRAYRLGLARLVCRSVPALPVSAMGLTFPNPVGLAAGMDKNGAHIDALGAFGFGFIEAGTVTPRPQAGNPKPRLFRLVPAQGLINRMGFNNDGVDRFVENVRSQTGFRRRGGIVGLNIGKSADTPMSRAIDDYRTALQRVYEHADYVAVNISSPNTKDLRALQAPRELTSLLAQLRDERLRLEDRHHRRIPLLVKIAPDLADDSIPLIADALVGYGIDGVIATNTTVTRDGVKGMRHSDETGGLSGRPLTERATHVIDVLARHLKGELPIIGVGGIINGADAVDKIQAGATLVQVYTGFIYAGPGIVADCVEAIRSMKHRATRERGARRAPHATA